MNMAAFLGKDIKNVSHVLMLSLYLIIPQGCIQSMVGLVDDLGSYDINVWEPGFCFENIFSHMFFHEVTQMALCLFSLSALHLSFFLTISFAS